MGDLASKVEFSDTVSGSRAGGVFVSLGEVLDWGTFFNGGRFGEVVVSNHGEEGDEE